MDAEEFLFLITKFKIRCYKFPPQQKGFEPLCYQGNDFYVLTSDSLVDDLCAFITYMFDCYLRGNRDACRIGFLCDNKDIFGDIHEACLREIKGNSFAIFTIEYALPIFKMVSGVRNNFFCFEGTTWNVGNNLALACDGNGKCPFEISYNDLAKYYFRSSSRKTGIQKKIIKVKEKGTLSDYINESKVRPRV